MSSFLTDVLNYLPSNPMAYAEFLNKIIGSSKKISDYLFERKFKKFIDGCFADDSLKKRFINLINKDGKKEENAFRIIEIINKCDCEEKVDFIINLTDAFINEYIDKESYFRLCKIVNDNLYEDLCFVRETIFNNMQIYDSVIQTLFSNGLMYQSSIDVGGHAYYSYTTIARYLDKYALSYKDDQRYPDKEAKPDAVNATTRIESKATFG